MEKYLLFISSIVVVLTLVVDCVLIWTMPDKQKGEPGTGTLACLPLLTDQSLLCGPKEDIMSTFFTRVCIELF